MSNNPVIHNGFNRPAAVFFDIDDTLYPERDFVFSGYNAVATVLKNEMGVTFDTANWLKRRFLSGKTAGAFDDLNESLDLGLDPPMLSRLIDIYRFHEPAIKPYDDIPGLLSELSVKWPLGIISDGPAVMQRNKYDKLGLGQFFCEEAVVFTDSLGSNCGKPSLAGFETGSDSLSIDDMPCAYVADNPAKDFLAPNQMGWLTIHVIREHQVHSSRKPPRGGEPAVVIDDVSELGAFFGNLIR